MINSIYLTATAALKQFSIPGFDHEMKLFIVSIQMTKDRPIHRLNYQWKANICTFYVSNDKPV